MFTAPRQGRRKSSKEVHTAASQERREWSHDHYVKYNLHAKGGSLLALKSLITSQPTSEGVKARQSEVTIWSAHKLPFLKMWRKVAGVSHPAKSCWSGKSLKASNKIQATASARLPTSGGW